MAVAAGRAFTFTYSDTLEALVASGLEILPFDPARDRTLPADAVGLIAGGGFPEVHAAELSSNAPLLADVKRRIAGGLPTWAECGGLLWLCRSLDGRPMVGAIPAEGRMTDRLTLGYRAATVVHDGPVAAAGATLRGHEFHYSPGGAGGRRPAAVVAVGRAVGGVRHADAAGHLPARAPGRRPRAGHPLRPGLRRPRRRPPLTCGPPTGGATGPPPTMAGRCARRAQR